MKQPGKTKWKLEWEIIPTIDLSVIMKKIKWKNKNK